MVCSMQQFSHQYHHSTKFEDILLGEEYLQDNNDLLDKSYLRHDRL